MINDKKNIIIQNGDYIILTNKQTNKNHIRVIVGISSRRVLSSFDLIKRDK